MNRSIGSALILLGLAGCSAQGPSAAADAPHASGAASSDAAVPSGPLRVTSFANVDDDGTILGVGVLVPATFFETVPQDDPAFQTSIGVEMPASVRDLTFVQLLRINWLAGGHGPAPYHAPHFDLHFYRGTKAEVSAISCPDPAPFAAELIPSGYETPSTCVAGMGYHAWPSADVEGGAFSASLILGYAAQKMVFIEPMITQELLVSRQDFELQIAQPTSAGGAPTLFPSHFSATYARATDSYRFQFEAFQAID